MWRVEQSTEVATGLHFTGIAEKKVDFQISPQVFRIYVLVLALPSPGTSSAILY